MSFKILGIGEALWDLLPTGPQVGGAPANFACHARALGARAGVVTRVGRDDYGRGIVDFFRKMGIAHDAVQTDDQAPTGTVTVTLSGQGIPHFTIHENVAWDCLEVTREALAAVRAADAISFGTLAQRSEAGRVSVQRLLSAAPATTLRVFDVNLRQRYFSHEVIAQSLQLANVLKLNDGELEVFSALFKLSGSVACRLETLAQRYGLQVVALTRGPAGSLLYQAGQWSDCAGLPIQIVDTVGAGDAFTAALVMGLLQRMELDQINSLADEVARYVCTRAGATPPLPKEFSERFAAHDAALKL
ncbi:MAG TPA: carbohydrate kinase [Verrucomicrobiae bacterium]|jgi:fructokinase|nr:carbohydrate kinase [Verrucomicrobiae bacterium]